MKTIKKLISSILIIFLFFLAACGTTPVAKADTGEYADQDAFLKAMAKGIQTRLSNVDDAKHANDTDEQRAAYYSRLVKYELDQIEKYDDAIFEDSKFDVLAHHYIHACQMQATATENVRNATLYNALWDGGSTARRGIIVTMYEQYDLPIDSGMVDNYRGNASTFNPTFGSTNNSTPQTSNDSVSKGKPLALGEPIEITTKDGTFKIAIESAHFLTDEKWMTLAKQRGDNCIFISVHGVIENINYKDSVGDYLRTYFVQQNLIVADQDGFGLESSGWSGPSDGLYEVSADTLVGEKKRVSMVYYANVGIESVTISIPGYEGTITLPIA